MRCLIGYVLAGLVIASPPFHGDGDKTRDATPTQIGPSPSALVSGVASGYLAHIDSVTHEFKEEPPVIPPDALPPGVSTSHAGLVEVRNDVSGGTMVDLQGRFQNLQLATIDEDGRVSIECLSEPPDRGMARARVDTGRK